MGLSKLNDTFLAESPSLYSLDETISGEVDGVNIIAKIKGPFFAVDGESLNNRFYSRNLWEKALNETSAKVESGEMVGTIGHDQVIDDKAFRDGLVSHRISKLWIDRSTGDGMGEVLVINNESGRNLNSYFRAKVPLAISSRAFGEYNGKTESGSDIINPETFVLEGFDFTRSPGIKNARPKLVEQSIDDLEDVHKPYEVKTSKKILSNPVATIQEKDNTMERELIESLSKDKISLQTNLGEALGKLKMSEAEIEGAKKVLASKEKELETASAKIADQAKEIESLNKAVTESTEKYNKYAALGPAAEVTALISSLKSQLEEYKKLGPVSELSESVAKLVRYNTESKVISLEEANELNEYRELGTLEEMNTAVDILESYSELGSPAEIAEMCDIVESYLELGTLEEISDVFDIMEMYSELGSPDEINTAFDLTESYIETSKSKVLDEGAQELASTYGLPLDTVKPLFESMGREGAVAAIESMTKRNEDSKVGSRFRKPAKELEESADISTPSSRTSRLFESFTNN